ncbi:twin-arginine translocation signal domain-containing protein [Pseudohalocynthiibacter aestuariivivens]|jgi:hypothetical protein|uniref:Twin-arginine translocation signal domain-containing protein n=1 Tax=Pseudohalocynthiibacter aestuariivivens TaxID=1591409 RepID=A0ABV5JLW7_9RHOB|nr:MULTISPECIES: twin-arginine translocation signal domain-containing protein [Pseudohalocynthiibacter]MBS9717554.1 twin-arginine translocation signal domain-containing protein [Pseudohalocynthiibacter aestuariivivens]MCK0102738.1 twin-arginine translocation signal domain-containing protein [Pseudohalocynthiibacter sp. F2068]
MKRRDFMKTAAAVTVASSTVQRPALAEPILAINAELKVRVLHLEPHSRGGYTLLSDGALEPRKLILPEVLDKAFGKGSFQALTQPDHWRMIDDGWFTDTDLFDPSETEGNEYDVWHANYKPECEAHDLLFDLFRDRLTGVIGYTIADLGLEFAEHPCTPRLATVRIVDKYKLEALIAAVAARTKWIVFNTERIIEAVYL